MGTEKGATIPGESSKLVPDVSRRTMLQRIGYSNRAIEVLESNRNIGEITVPDIYLVNDSGCGDILMLYLSIEKDMVEDAKFRYIGCAGLQAAASALTEMVKGVGVEDALNIDEAQVIGYLGEIPPHKYECVEFAVQTLRKALMKYHSEVRQSA